MTACQQVQAGMGGRAPLSVTANNVSRLQTGTEPDALVTTVESPNTTPSGGTPGYTFAWTPVGGSVAITVSSATAQNPTWSADVLSGTPEVATWRVTVTDNLGATAFAEITVTLNYAQI